MRWLLLACAGCGRIAFDSPPAQLDADVDARTPSCVTASFDDDQLPTEMETYGMGTVEMTGGRVRIVISGTQNLDAGVTAKAPMSHVGRATAVRVTPSMTAAASTALGWHPTSSTLSTHLEMDGTNLKHNTFDTNGNVYSEFIARPYDPIAHAWWRFREDNGAVLAEVSSDGVAWNHFSTLPVQIDVTSLKWDFGLGSYLSDVGPTESSFDNLTECTD
jgi:hypothetical protein